MKTYIASLGQLSLAFGKRTFPERAFRMGAFPTHAFSKQHWLIPKDCWIFLSGWGCSYSLWSPEFKFDAHVDHVTI